MLELLQLPRLEAHLARILESHRMPGESFVQRESHRMPGENAALRNVYEARP